MTDLTLPGEIPGLLRRGSPVTHVDGSRLVVVELDGNDAKLPSGWAFTRLLTLDLSDATGRAHAAWWLLQRYSEVGGLQETVSQHFGCPPVDVYCVVSDAAYGERTTDDRTDFLRRVVLYVAGVDDNG